MVETICQEDSVSRQILIRCIKINFRQPTMKKKYLIIFTFSCLLLSSCCSRYTQSFCCAPGKCQKAIDSFAVLNPIMVALETYKTDHAKYPKNLNLLVNEHINMIPSDKVIDLKYLLKESEYELTFTYYGPGMNICTYSSKSKSWGCYGLF